MFPNFMNDMLIDARCGHCDSPQSVADIRVVGVRPPEEFEAFYGEPVFVFIAICKNCGQWTSHTMRRSRAESMIGVSSFIDLIEKECEGKKPPINIPGLGKKPASTSVSTPSVKNPPVVCPRPSRSRNHPNTPPTQKEIQQFLQRLRKTSFKRGSKGFANWMKDMGANTNEANEGDAPGDKPAI